MAAIAYKTPDEIKDYSLDYAALGKLAAGETIVSSTWSASDSSLLLSPPFASINSAGTITTVWLSGGNTVGGDVNSYEVTNEVVTSQGRTFSESFICQVSQYNQL